MFGFASKMLNTIMGTDEGQPPGPGQSTGLGGLMGQPQQQQQQQHQQQHQSGVRPMGGFPQVRPAPQVGGPRPYGGPPTFSGPRPSPAAVGRGVPPNFGGPPRPMGGGPGTPHRFNGPQPATSPGIPRPGMPPGGPPPGGMAMRPGAPPGMVMRPRGPGPAQGPGPGPGMLQPKPTPRGPGMSHIMYACLCFHLTITPIRIRYTCPSNEPFILSHLLSPHSISIVMQCICKFQELSLRSSSCYNSRCKFYVLIAKDSHIMKHSLYLLAEFKVYKIHPSKMGFYS